jgi:hypothetical protein
VESGSYRATRLQALREVITDRQRAREIREKVSRDRRAEAAEGQSVCRGGQAST